MEVRQLFRAKSPLVDRREVRDSNTLILGLVEANHAFEAVVESRPDLVLLDWIMPTMNGGDVARQIRSDSRVRDTRILFLSAIILKRDSPGELAGCPAVAKPIGIHELVEAIDEQLRQVA